MNYDFYDNMNVFNEYISPNNLANNNQIDFFNPYEAYLKGNAFKSEYLPYKNYKVPRIMVNNEQDEMLLNIGEYSFMMHDMNLLLDIEPENREALRKFGEYRNKLNDLIIKYERKYGPLTVRNTFDNNKFQWISSWPWVK